MSSSKKETRADCPPRNDMAGKPGNPQWTSGLKRLYDSVVDEPLPDSFTDLLAKLDADASK
ncbi:MAG: NepR family anti-sigma factor [Alteraurantiacibacter sp.]